MLRRFAHLSSCAREVLKETAAMDDPCQGADSLLAELHGFM
jgi:hypothetical protein